MTLEDLTTIDQLEDFLSGTQAVAFSVISDKEACYIQRAAVTLDAHREEADSD